MAPFTLKGIPDQTLARLLDMATAERRSLNQQVIYLLERATAESNVSAQSAFDAFLELRAELHTEGPEDFLPERDQSSGRDAPSFD